MRSFRVAALIAAAFLAGALHVRAAGTGIPKATQELVVAKVNGDPITVKQLLEMFTDKHSGHATFLGGEAEARSFLDLVINDHLLIDEAYSIGLDEDPEVRAVVEEFETNKAVGALLKEEIDEKSSPTKDEVTAIWKKYGTQVVQLRQIAVATRSEAEEIRAALLAGGDFDTIARSCSIARSALNGGHVMTMWGTYSPEWEAAVFELEPGTVSPVIETSDDFQVVIVDDVFPIERAPLETAYSNIENILRLRKTEARKKAFSADLWSKYHVQLQQIDDEHPAALVSTRATAPDTVVATWDGGRTTLADAFDAGELEQISRRSAAAAKKEIQTRIRVAVNESVVRLEAESRQIASREPLRSEIEAYRNVMMENALFRDHIFKDIDTTVTDDQLRKYYDANLRSFIAPEERHVAQIMTRSEADAQMVLGKLIGGGDFAVLAKEYSRDFATALSGGDLGWILEEKVPQAFKEILSLAPGGISKPIQFENAWRIIKVLEVKPARQLSFEEANKQIREGLLQNRKQEVREFWIQKLRAAAKIEIRDSAIKQFVKETEKLSSDAPSPTHSIPAGAPPDNHSSHAEAEN